MKRPEVAVASSSYVEYSFVYSNDRLGCISVARRFRVQLIYFDFPIRYVLVNPSNQENVIELFLIFKL